MKKISRRVKKFLKQVEVGEENLGVRATAKKIGCSPATLSRALKEEGKRFPPPKPQKRLPTEKLNQAMALVFLRLNRDQIKQLVGVKSGTLRKYLMELIMEVPDEGPPSSGRKRIIFNSDKWDEWAKTLGEKYDLAELVRYIPCQIEKFPNVVVDEKELMRLLKAQLKETSCFVAGKMGEILERKVSIQDGFIVTRGYDKKVVRIPVGRFC
jgi:hypothetical protein